MHNKDLIRKPRKLSMEQADDDVRKTMEQAELGAKDPQFMYRVQADNEGWIKILMWANGNSRLQYTSFGDVITCDNVSDKSVRYVFQAVFGSE